MLMKLKVLSFLVLLAGVIFATESKSREIVLSVDSPTVVTQGETSIKVADVKAFIHGRIPEDRWDEALQGQERMQQIFSSLIVTMAMAQEAKAVGLLEREGVQAELYLRLAELLRNYYRDYYLTSVELETYELPARELYLTQPEMFRGPTTIDFDHILIRSSNEMSEVEMMERVIELHKRLALDEDFAEIALEYSDDPSVSENHGTFKSVDVRELVPQVSAILEETPVGELADPVRSRFGWHIVRLRSVNEGELLTWDEARSFAEARSRERHLERALERRIRALQSGNVTVDEDAIDRLLSLFARNRTSSAQDLERILLIEED